MSITAIKYQGVYMTPQEALERAGMVDGYEFFALVAELVNSGFTVTIAPGERQFKWHGTVTGPDVEAVKDRREATQ
jgi:ABC-type antimicrobial peptide transport system permease subunit